MNTIKPLKWHAVDSSAIKALAYNRKGRVLIVQFNHGSSYRYEGIGYQRYNQLKNAESIGKYFNEAIKPRRI